MRITRENTLTALNLHLLVVVVLVIANLVLLTRLLLAWHTLHADNAAQVQQDLDELRTLQLQNRPLQDLPAKISGSSRDANRFYASRIPENYSSITAELGTLAQKDNVRLNGVQYLQAPAIHDLLEVRMAASLSGDYTSMMRFINGLERDRMFFVIQGLTFTGQQGGNVNLRLLLTTYLHGPGVDRAAPPAIHGIAPQNGEGQ
jgi:type IV pilus assembly protein PilO